MFNFLKKIVGPAKIEDMEQAAKIVSNILKELTAFSKEGTNLLDIEKRAEEMIKEAGATPYNKGYHPRWAPGPYPAVTCLSLNEEVVHAPPRDRKLHSGDVLKIDLGIRFKSGCGDAATTILVGKAKPKDLLLMSACRKVIMTMREIAKDGVPVTELGKVAERISFAHHVLPVTQYGGHGIGREMHEEPYIPNWNDRNATGILREGMVVCLEPMLTNSRTGRTDIKADGWTAYQKDGATCVQLEDMILITKEGCRVLTNHIN